MESMGSIANLVTQARIFAALLAAALAFAAATAGCGSDRSSLTVFAAASLADALQPLGEQFEAEHNTDVRFSFGGSTTLRSR